MGRLQRLMIDAIRALRGKTDTVYDLCAKAPLQRLPCMAIGPRGGTVITPWHVAYAAHYPLQPGSVVKYDWGERKVEKVSIIGKTDIGIATLTEAVPESVTPARMLPHDWHLDMRTQRNTGRLRRSIRAIGSRASGEIVEAELMSISEKFGANGPWASGDSGQPVILPLPEPILIGCLLYATSGPTISHYWDMIPRLTWEQATTMLPGETWYG